MGLIKQRRIMCRRLRFHHYHSWNFYIKILKSKIDPYLSADYLPKNFEEEHVITVTAHLEEVYVNGNVLVAKLAGPSTSEATGSHWTSSGGSSAILVNILAFEGQIKVCVEFYSTFVSLVDESPVWNGNKTKFVLLHSHYCCIVLFTEFLWDSFSPKPAWLGCNTCSSVCNTVLGTGSPHCCWYPFVSLSSCWLVLTVWLAFLSICCQRISFTVVIIWHTFRAGRWKSHKHCHGNCQNRIHLQSNSTQLLHTTWPRGIIRWTSPF